MAHIYMSEELFLNNMALNAENKIVIPLEATIWLSCTVIALGSYWAKIDISFWPGLITWAVFIIGIVYFILYIFG